MASVKKHLYKSFALTGIVAIFMGLYTVPGQASEIPQSITYQEYTSPSDSPLYDIAFHAIKPMFYDDDYYFVEKNLILYPDLMLTEVDLNGDALKEIIVGNVENVHDYPIHCTPQNICPFHIIQMRNKKPVIIGKIKAYTVGLASEREDGYQLIKAYQDKDLNVFALLKYDAKKDQYLEIKR